MKKFIVSVVIGGCAGALMAMAFLFIAPKLPAIFAHAFFYPSTQTVALIQKSIPSSQSKTYSDQYHIDTVDRSIPQEGKVLYADLFSMQIYLYQNGEQIAQYPIKSIGREGTAWQTPLGKFDMSYKTENHFSSIGSVWMPYSMHFFGNYFIHGWPYYSGGRPVAEGYSGGCIRLDTPDAKEIFEFVDRETQLIVTSSKKSDSDAGHVLEYQRTQDAPRIDADFLIVDMDTGEVIASSNSQNPQPIGSFAKLMTALISLETLNQYQETIFEQSIVTVGDLLYPLLMHDDSVAGDLLYKHKNTRQYVLDMNTRAQSLGMSDTIYADANGTNTQTISTLDDTVRLFMYFNEYKPFILKTLSQKTYTKNGLTIAQQFNFENDLYTAGFVNAGNTSALALFSNTFSKQTNEESMQKNLMIIVHGSFDASSDSKQLYDWVTQSVVLK